MTGSKLTRSNTAIRRPSVTFAALPGPTIPDASQHNDAIGAAGSSDNSQHYRAYDNINTGTGKRDIHSPSRQEKAESRVVTAAAPASGQPEGFAGTAGGRPRTTGNMDDADTQNGIDPISRHILSLTASSVRGSATYNGSSSPVAAASQFADPSEPGSSITRTDSLMSNRGTKEKKKGFLSRILGNKSKETTSEATEDPTELSQQRSVGAEAEVFSQPLGYVPSFPAPPRYIRVRAQNRRKRSLDRLFLAQILSQGITGRTASQDVDSKIHGINERPVIAPPNSTRTKNNAVWAAEFSKDGQYFAAAGQDSKLKVWRVISNSDDREVSGGDDEKDIRLNAPVFKQQLIREYEGHTSAILDLSWSKNNFLLSSSMDKTVRLYHISRPECLCAFKHNDFVTSIAFHPRDDRFFLAGSLDSKLRLWSIPDKNVAFSANVSDMVTAVAFTPDGKTAIAGTLSGLCILYDTDGLKAHSQIHVRSNRGKNSKGSKITGMETIQVNGENRNPEVKLLITSNDSRIRLYNLRDRSLEIKFRGNENTTSQIRASFSDDGKYVICGSEDKKVYIWPTGPVERADVDKRPVEIFDAHRSTVTTALFLPTKSRICLARSGDPIYDLCNPPPVRLLSRADSVLSSRAPTEYSENQQPSQPDASESAASPPEETPQYSARHAHPGGLILVTGDYTGEIKVFRQDCAYQKRRETNWETSSFSRKMLARSGSVTTKASERSSLYRRSMNLPERGPQNRDSIISWRNTVMTPKSPSATTSLSDQNDSYRSQFNQDRDRSTSPGSSTKRNLAHRLSLRHGSTPLTTITNGSSGQQSSTQQNSNTDHHRHSQANPTGLSSLNPNNSNNASSSARTNSHETNQTMVPDIALTEASPVLANQQHKQNETGEDDNLFLIGDQSYMAWDVKHKFLPMAQNQPRTPGPSTAQRTLSYVSSLSAENSSTASIDGHAMNGLGIAAGDRSEGEAEELRCKKCGNETFAMVKRAGSAGHGLKCRHCGHIVQN